MSQGQRQKEINCPTCGHVAPPAVEPRCGRCGAQFPDDSLHSRPTFRDRTIEKPGEEKPEEK